MLCLSQISFEWQISLWKKIEKLKTSDKYDIHNIIGHYNPSASINTYTVFRLALLLRKSQ